jgi:hypothetical protein
MKIEDLVLSNSRHEFNEKLDEVIDGIRDVYSDNALYCLVLADRLAVLGASLREAAKDDAELELLLKTTETGENTIVHDNEKFTLSVSKQWEYPVDSYTKKVTKELDKTVTALSGLKDSLKNHQEKQRLDGVAKLISETNTIKIAKK